MTDQRSFFTDFKDVPSGTWTVNGVGSTKLDALGIGSIPITSFVHGNKISGVLQEVLYIPKLGTNFFSIGIANEAGIDVHFFKNTAIFTKNEAVIMTGKRVGKSLYHLKIIATNADPVAAAATTQTSIPLTLMHLRCAHLNFNIILKMDRLGAVDGLKLDKRQRDADCLCEGCIFGKMKRTPFKTGRTRATKVDEIIHCDSGFSPIKTFSGETSYILLKDDYSEWTQTTLMKRKSEAEEHLVNFIAFIENISGNSAKIVRTDGGTEFGSNRLKNYFNTKGIVHQTTNPYTPQQNGVSERMNRTAIESTRSSLHMRTDKGTNLFKTCENSKLELWGEFLKSAIYVLNRTLSCSSSKTPFERLYGRKPNIENFRIVGCRAYPHVPSEKHKKLDPKGIPCWFVGYGEETRGWILWDPVNRKLIQSRDVIFDEKLLISDIQEPESVGQKDSDCSLFDPLLLVTEILGLDLGTESDDQHAPVVDDALTEGGDDDITDDVPEYAPEDTPVHAMDENQDNVADILPIPNTPGDNKTDEESTVDQAQPPLGRTNGRSNRIPQYSARYNTYRRSL